MKLRQRKSIRLKNYDYSQNGCYFITICTKNRKMLFGEIMNETMFYTEYGKIAEKELLITLKKRPYLSIDNYVIMPNHIHILISLYQNDLKDTARRVRKYPRYLFYLARSLSRTYYTQSKIVSENLRIYREQCHAMGIRLS
jgi:REP element-mobilizing transposase RayT